MRERMICIEMPSTWMMKMMKTMTKMSDGELSSLIQIDRALARFLERM
jgi:hypothetical protein